MHILAPSWAASRLRVFRQDFSKQIVYGYRERTLVQKIFSRLQSVVTKTIELKPGSCSLAHLACVCVRTQCLVVLQSPRWRDRLSRVCCENKYASCSCRFDHVAFLSTARHLETGLAIVQLLASSWTIQIRFWLGLILGHTQIYSNSSKWKRERERLWNNACPRIIGCFQVSNSRCPWANHNQKLTWIGQLLASSWPIAS